MRRLGFAVLITAGIVQRRKPLCRTKEFARRATMSVGQSASGLIEPATLRKPTTDAGRTVLRTIIDGVTATCRCAAVAGWPWASRTTVFPRRQRC